MNSESSPQITVVLGSELSDFLLRESESRHEYPEAIIYRAILLYAGVMPPLDDGNSVQLRAKDDEQGAYLHLRVLGKLRVLQERRLPLWPRGPNDEGKLHIVD